MPHVLGFEQDGRIYVLSGSGGTWFRQTGTDRTPLPPVDIKEGREGAEIIEGFEHYAAPLLADVDRDGVREMRRRGRDFLVASQEEDGGWPGTTRPAGGDSYAQRVSTSAWAAMALLATYALLWRVVPYGGLTGIVLLAFLRLTGLRWRGAIVAAAVMAITLQLLFERGLGVRF